MEEAGWSYIFFLIKLWRSYTNRTNRTDRRESDAFALFPDDMIIGIVSRSVIYAIPMIMLDVGWQISLKKE